MYLRGGNSLMYSERLSRRELIQDKYTICQVRAEIGNDI
jgi:hypothetical protein